MSNFFTLRGREFYGGLVVRKFLDLKPAGIHPKTHTPVPVEYRTFVLRQQPIITTKYWEVDYPSDSQEPPQEWLRSIASKIVSPFVALDIAQDKNDKWWLIEVNDGGSAGYPEWMDAQALYHRLYTGA